MLVNQQTQLAHVLDYMSDKQWHCLSDIASHLNIAPQSAASRLRDLRLSKFGKHTIEIRKTSNPHVFEYRLATPTINPPQVGTVSPTFTVPQANFTPNSGFGFVRFLNTQTLQVENIPKTRCRVDASQGFKRIVALNPNNQIIPHLITTDETL